MKKKSLLFGLAALLTFAIGFSGCDTALDETTAININERHDLPAPQNVKATAYPGVNVVTWDLVKDASGYQIIRKDKTSLETKVLETVEVTNTTTDKTVLLLDKVAFANQLIDGHEYQYTVKAVSNSIYNAGEASASVKATIPVRGDAAVNPVKVPAKADIQVQKLVIDNGEYLEVLWTDKDASFAEYTVEYFYGQEGATSGSFTGPDSDNKNRNPIHQTLFPLIGGVPVVKITGSWADTYYVPVSILKDDVTAFTSSVLEQVANTFKAIRGKAADESTGIAQTIVTLKWAKVVGATGYSVYRTERVTTGNPTAADTFKWETVTVTPTLTGLGSDEWLVAQDTVALDKNYQYLIVATGADGAKSKSPRTSTVVEAYTEQWDAPTSLEAKVTDIATKKVTVSWDEADGVTYTLARAVITTPDSGGTWAEEAYTTIELTATNASKVNNHQTVLETLPAYRTAYRYKLTAVKAGLTKTATKDIKDAPFNSYNVGLSLTSTETSTTVNYAIDVVASASYGDVLTAQVWQAEYNSGKAIEESQWAKIGDPVPFNGTLVTVVSSGLDALKLYVYRVEIFTGTGASAVKLQNVEVTQQGIRPSTVAYNNFETNFTSTGTIGTTTKQGVYTYTPTGLVIPAADLARYVGAKIFVSEKNSSIFATMAPVGTVLVNNTANANTTAVPGVTIPAYSYYFIVPKPANAATGANDTYYYGSEKNDGGSTSIQSIGKSVSIDDTGVPTYDN